MSPRSALTNEHMREHSRERILTAALEVFAEKGFHNATISDITARAQVSRGLITYYFPGKSDLIRELLARYLDGLVTLVDVTGTPDERLASIIDGIVVAIADTLPVQRVMLSTMIHPSTQPLFAEVESVLDEQLTIFEELLRGLFTDRGSPDPALEEVMFRSVMEGVIFKASVYSDAYPLEAVRTRLHEMYGLPTPQDPLFDGDPAPFDRLRVPRPGRAKHADLSH
jgi:AcrR family transcriptional regulator